MQDTDTAAPNAKRLLWAGFMAILAAGVGFSIRGGILDNWALEFGFSATDLGAIGGAGFTGFCFGIIIGGVIADKIGYGKLVVAAFGLHALSAFVTFGAEPEQAQSVSYNYLYWGTFLFAIANGCLEAVANPLVATLFPHNRTHYLNILHASWPAGLILGGALGWVLDDRMELHWKYQLGLFLIPTVFYGLMFLGQRMPKSEASEQGLSLGEMFKDVGILGGVVVCALLALFFGNAIGLESGTAYSLAGGLLVILLLVTHTHGPRGESIIPLGSLLLLTLFVTHAFVGSVELGTDGWIQNITGNILSSEQGKILFVFTSALMFALRFCADFIEKRLGFSPVAILLLSAILACLGLNLASGINTFMGAVAALAVYGIGKTFFWPTMLAVASDRFPKSGAIAISIMGGVGMLSAGLMGSPGLGYCKDRFSGEALREKNPAIFADYKAEKASSFLLFGEAVGLDAKKLGDIQGRLNDARKILETGKVEDLKEEKLASLPEREQKAIRGKHASMKAIEAKLRESGVLKDGGNTDPEAAFVILTPEEREVNAASIEGDRRTLTADSAIPAIMAVIYLLLLLYFKSIGGYKAIKLDASTASTN